MSLGITADEICDTIDNDCDTEIDEADSIDAPSWYLDFDGDGYGNSAYSLDGCAAPTGYAEDGTDCDDTDAAINPGSAEVCNGEDDEDFVGVATA